MKVIAYYLPQFHPTPENDAWWGKGFTEWTNVAKAKPLFKGHKQPKIPADLGFYDLRLPEAREAQAEMARYAGVSAFCYWNYWFGGGKKMLRLPFDAVVDSGKPDFPFCLAWANHSWYNKTWDSKNGHFSVERSKLLIEQKYLGESDYTNYFYDLLKAFRDKRYFTINGKLVFVIYDPKNFSDFNLFKEVWDHLAKKEGLPGFYYIAHIFLNLEIIPILYENGYDAINLSLHHKPFKEIEKQTTSFWTDIFRAHVGIKPQIVSYDKAIRLMDSELFEDDKIYPTIIPNWDHTPRSGNFGRLFSNCTPNLFQEHVQMILNRIKHKKSEDQVIFLKSWNEWGEGNYMEPDLEWGLGRIDVLRKTIIG